MLELQTMVKSVSIGIQFSWGSGGAVNSLFPVSSEWLPGTASKDEAPESSYSFICKSTYFNTLFFLGGAPASICHFFCLSVHLSVRLSIYLLCTIFQEPCIMWSLFLVHMCKMMTYPGVFFIFFFNFDFLGC